MIIYDLKCRNGHAFEGWFKGREAFEQQKAEGLIACPVCKATDAEVVPSSVAIMGKKENRSPEQTPQSPALPLRAVQEFFQKHFDDVGDKFAEVALRMHQGEEEGRNIRGTATPHEEEDLKKEGVAFIKLPLPKFDA